MAVADQAGRLAETRRAFDNVAGTYDASNVSNPLLCAMRSRFLAALTSRLPAGARLLDLGCGPGADVEALARQGYAVTALDWSPAMVEQTARRVARAGLDHRVEVHRLGIHELDRLPPGVFDAAYSNFGPLNCVPDLDEAVAQIVGRLRPGGLLVASIIGRLCPWEVALYLARGDLARVGLRFRRGVVPVPLAGRTVWMRYYTPGEFSRVCRGAGLRRIALRAQGLIVPPPYLEAFARRHRTLVAGLQRVEDRVAMVPGFRSSGDHFLATFTKGA